MAPFRTRRRSKHAATELGQMPKLGVSVGNNEKLMNLNDRSIILEKLLWTIKLGSCSRFFLRNATEKVLLK